MIIRHVMSRKQGFVAICIAALFLFVISDILLRQSPTSFISQFPFQLMNHPLQNTSKCSPKSNIMFLKVHKAGSSTVYNVMMRYALGHDLNVVIPNKDPNRSQHNYIGYGNHLTKQMILPIPKGEQYNILTNHVVYNRTFFDTILPNDTFYFAIIRDPEDRFISAASYYGLLNHLSKKDETFDTSPFVFEEFLSNPEEFGYTDHVHNHMAHDFGVPRQFYDNSTFLHSYIQKLDNEFNLVLLMDYFDESLILLKRFLCWTHKDVLYIKKNARRKPAKKIILSEKDSQRLKIFQFADVMIYEYFYKKFWRVLNSFGTDIHEEVGHFKDVRRRMESFCSTFMQLDKTFLELPNSKWDSAFNITISDCDILTKPELDILKIARYRTLKRMNITQSFTPSIY